MRRTVAVVLLAVALLECGSSGSKGDSKPTTPRVLSPEKIEIVLDNDGLTLLSAPIREGSYTISFEDRRTGRPATETSVLQFGLADSNATLFEVPDGTERLGSLYRNVVPYVAINGARKQFPQEGEFVVETTGS